MTYFLYQIGLLSTVAIMAGTVIGWWLHYYYGKSNQDQADNDLSVVKNYLGESVKENARLKLQLKQAEEKLESLSNDDGIPGAGGIDFEAYQAFENTIKEASLRKYLS